MANTNNSLLGGAEISFNNGTLTIDRFKSLEIFNSIDYLPYGFIEIDDDSGDYLKNFVGVQVGAEMSITFTVGDSTIKFPIKFVNLGLESVYRKIENGASGFKLWFGHPWFLYKDTKSKCYGEVNSSDLIKTILTDKSRGVDFDVDSSRWSSSIGGNLPRYKIGIDDLAFVKRVLSTASTNSDSPHLFVNDSTNKFNLLDFDGLMSSTAFCRFVPRRGNTEMADSQISAFNISNYAGAKYDLPMEDNQEETVFCDLSVLKPDVRFFDSNEGRFYKMRLAANGCVEGYLPIDKSFYKKKNSTGLYNIGSASLYDCGSRIKAYMRETDHMIQFQVATSFNNMLHAGDPCYVAVPETSIDGKWLIKERHIVFQLGNSPIEKYTLVRRNLSTVGASAKLQLFGKV